MSKRDVAATWGSSFKYSKRVKVCQLLSRLVIKDADNLLDPRL